MPNRIARLSLCALLLSPFTALAIDQIKPGQWETSVTIQGLPAIAPEQLEQLRQFGIELPVGGHAIVTQQCITPEQAKLKQPLLPQTEDGCSVRNYQHSGDKVTGDISCNGAIQGNGRFDMTLLSDSAFEGRISMQGIAQGLPVNQNSTIIGKWVNSACDADIPTDQP
ncbi:DUF3617 domain-containing protein [Methylobacillus flagellatus]|uniref:DUF3617 domain-containing protein n=3 Tax=root TaxID=1 RepID=Q1H2B9_METFK|nr:DUF3617 domain-containing protein [Methylobacillus flagellatus]ABE49224.1 conserved hypothetical protein [Methylobacillus flagellatus KT]ABE49368.1 conserved hypothetical protein [Methylobacillus flagellatus KT]ABZ07180.1 hypothetical protein ALOHA_HF4000ANIW133B20ctg3g13 [uncultured marine microorganism HF4000_ANIW133B20]ABZ07616.1 hypothetical protein ALOHA_HF4000ANIW137K11ctg5g7 [uncultured marine microorganism HF4000_ANIW137K11]